MARDHHPSNTHSHCPYKATSTLGQEHIDNPPKSSPDPPVCLQVRFLLRLLTQRNNKCGLNNLRQYNKNSIDANEISPEITTRHRASQSGRSHFISLAFRLLPSFHPGTTKLIIQEAKQELWPHGIMNGFVEASSTIDWASPPIPFHRSHPSHTQGSVHGWWLRYVQRML